MINNTQNLELRQQLNVQKLKLPKLSKAWVQLQNALLAAKVSFNLNLNNASWQGQFVESSILPRSWKCVLNLKIGGQECDCYLENLTPFAEPPLNVQDFHVIPKELLHIIIENNSKSILESLSKTFGYSCELEDFHLNSNNEPLSESDLNQSIAFKLCSVNSEHKDVTFGFITSLPKPLMQSLLSNVEQYTNELTQEDASIPPVLAKANTVLNLIWQWQPMSLLELEQLAIGDCLLLPLDKNINILLNLGNAFAKAQLNLNTRVITVESFMQDNIENLADQTNVELDTPTENPAEDNASPLAQPTDCPIAVQCQLGSVSLSLNEVSKLSAGMVLGPLASLESAVNICIGNTSIGRGSIVDIDGRVGVQITEIFSK